MRYSPTIVPSSSDIGQLQRWLREEFERVRASVADLYKWAETPPEPGPDDDPFLPLTGGTLTGNLEFNGPGLRLRGDFSNANIAQKLNFQTTTPNGDSYVSVGPNGTARGAGWLAYNSVNFNNCAWGGMYVSAGGLAIVVDKVGSAAYLPMVFQTGGAERMRIDEAGNVTIAGGNTTINGGYINLKGSVVLPIGSVIEMGRYVDFHGGNATDTDYDIRFECVGLSAAGAGVGIWSALSMTFQRNSNDASSMLDIKNQSGGNAACTTQRWLTSANEVTSIVKYGPGTAFPNLTEIKCGANGNQAFQIISSTFRIPAVYNNTGAGTAVVVASDGTMVRQSSSARYKSDIRDYDRPGIETNERLRPVTFAYSSDESGARQAGLIAEDLDALGLSEFVVYEQNRPEGISYGNLAAHFIKTLQEQQAMLNDLCDRIIALERAA